MSVAKVDAGLLSSFDLPDSFADFKQQLIVRRRSTASKTDKHAQIIQLKIKQQAPEYLTQSILLLHGPRQPYSLSHGQAIPQCASPYELLVRVKAIGLNPVDWKSPDYNFGLPQLPFLGGRDFAGVVVKAASAPRSLQVGDVVLCTTTDYRDFRKAAFQEYAVTTQHNTCKLPATITANQGACIGVAYVAAVLALGVCLGVNYAASDQPQRGPDLKRILELLPLDALPGDVVAECLTSIEAKESPAKDDWIAIWGGSTTTATFLSQLARLAGLKVILVVNLSRHGERLAGRQDCLLVDDQDPDRAVEIIRGVTGGTLRFAIDTVGKETAASLSKALNIPTRKNDSPKRVHLVGLSGLPKTACPGTVHHSVPIKLFHEVPEIGCALMNWLEMLLTNKLLTPPDITVAPGGLAGINDALDRMRRGEISGRRLVVPI